MDSHNTNYGGTRSNPPPPYSSPSAGLAQSDSRDTYIPVPVAVAHASLPFASETGESKRKGWTGSKMFIAIVTFALTVALCLHSLPVTSCNDPLDPAVRDRIREEWSNEVLVYDRQAAKREVENARWKQEEAEHAELVREWEYERIHHQQELRDRAAREEDERRRLNLFWARVQAHQCTTYGTREYTAILVNIPAYWEHRVEACKSTPLEVHGVSYLPKSCEDKGPGIVVGRWEINQYEPDCAPHWGWRKDKESPSYIRPALSYLSHIDTLQGCTSPGSGKRRIEYYLENLPYGGDWREFCATTPVDFLGLEFSGAQECYQWNYGTYGLWEIEDFNCH